MYAIRSYYVAWHITNAASGVAAGCCFPVDVLIKSAPEYMDKIEVV